MSPPLFFVLHDVGANTYSRDLIPNPGLRNLRRLFEVVPRSYNRSKAACDRVGVMLVRYKHATPLAGIHMVSWRRAARGVRSAVQCVEKDHDAALVAVSGGGGGGGLRAGGGRQRRSRGGGGDLARNVALAGVGLGALAAAASLYGSKQKQDNEPKEKEKEKEKERLRQEQERLRQEQEDERRREELELEDAVRRRQAHVKLANRVLEAVRRDDAQQQVVGVNDEDLVLKQFQADEAVWGKAVMSHGMSTTEGTPQRLLTATFNDPGESARCTETASTLNELQNEIFILTKLDKVTTSRGSKLRITPRLYTATLILKGDRPNKTILSVDMGEIERRQYTISSSKNLFTYLCREFADVTPDNRDTPRPENRFAGRATTWYRDELKDIARRIYDILVTLDEQRVFVKDLSVYNFGVIVNEDNSSIRNIVIRKVSSDTAAVNGDAASMATNNVYNFCLAQFELFKKLTDKARALSSQGVNFLPLLLLVQQLSDIVIQKNTASKSPSIYVLPPSDEEEGVATSYFYDNLRERFSVMLQFKFPTLLTEKRQQLKNYQTELNVEAFRELKASTRPENVRCDVRQSNITYSKSEKIDIDQYYSYGKFYAVSGYSNVMIKEYKAACYPFLTEKMALSTLAESEIAPRLLDFYICVPAGETLQTATPKKTKYGYLTDAFKMTFKQYLQTGFPQKYENIKDDRVRQTTIEKNLQGFALKIFNILSVLDRKRVYHRDLSLSNFVLKRDSSEELLITNFEKATIFLPELKGYYHRDRYDRDPDYGQEENVPPEGVVSNVECFLDTQRNALDMYTTTSSVYLKQFTNILIENVSRLNAESKAQ